MSDLWFRRIFILFTLLMVCGLIPSAAFSQDDLPPAGKPLTLKQCIAIALKYQPSLRASAANIEASKAALEQSLANYYPQVNLNNTYSTSTYNYGGAAIASVRRYSWTFTDVTSSALTLSQNIYDFWPHVQCGQHQQGEHPGQ